MAAEETETNGETQGTGKKGPPKNPYDKESEPAAHLSFRVQRLIELLKPCLMTLDSWKEESMSKAQLNTVKRVSDLLRNAAPDILKNAVEDLLSLNKKGFRPEIKEEAVTVGPKFDIGKLVMFRSDFPREDIKRKWPTLLKGNLYVNSAYLPGKDVQEVPISVNDADSPTFFFIKKKHLVVG